MNMSSHSSASLRRFPQQKRGRRRVAGFLRAAAGVFAEKGYESATMHAIAGRARSCIGSLYQFFPNKLALAEAIRDQYSNRIEQSWAALGCKAANLSSEELACELVTLQLEIVSEHPALLALLDMPTTSRTKTRRELIRARIAIVLVAHKPRMSRAMAMRVALVVQQISRGLLAIYAKANADEKKLIVEEFKAALSGYLAPKLKQ